MLTWAASCSDASVSASLERALSSAVESDAAVGLRRALKTERERASTTPILRALYTDSQDDADEDGGDEKEDASESVEPTRKRRRQNANAATTSQQLPIDHIFQFHNALRLELRRLEHDILAISSTGTHQEDSRLVRMIDGRFVFLRGVYEAHSMSEDDIVFPALEAKSALSNVSHSYTLDHKQESELMKNVVDLIAEMRATVSNEKGKRGFREGLVNDIQQACVAMRVSMVTSLSPFSRSRMREKREE